MVITDNIMHNKSYLKRYLVSYLIVFLIPFITIISIYFTSDRMMRQEIINSSESGLQQFFTFIDKNMSELTEIGTRALGSDIVQSYAFASNYQNKREPYKEYKIKNFLSNFYASNLDDLFVYFDYYDVVVSASNSSLSSQYYYQTYYKDKTTLDDFEACISLDRYYRPTLITLGIYNNMPLLAVAMKQNVSFRANKNLDVTVVMVMEPQILQELLQGSVFHRSGEVLIFDNENQMLATSGQMDSNINLMGFDGIDTSYNDTFGQEEYVIYIRESKVINAYYVSAVPIGYFWYRLNQLRLIGITGLAACILISGFITTYLSKKNYSPIDSVLTTIRHRSNLSYNRKLDNEFDFIEEVIEKTFDNNARLKGQLLLEPNTSRDKFLILALLGTIREEPYEDDIFKKHDIMLLSDAFIVALLQIEQINPKVIENTGNPDEKGMLSFLLKNVLQELCSVDHQGFVVKLEDRMYALVINFNNKETVPYVDAAKMICQKGSQFLDTRLGIQSTITISNASAGLKEIHTAYLEALRALEYRYSYGKGSLITYDDISQKPFHYKPVSESKSAQYLMQYVKEESLVKNARSVIQDILREQSISGDSSLETLSFFKMDIVNLINRIIFDIGAGQVFSTGKTKQLLIHETFDEFLEQLESIIKDLCSFEELRKLNNNVCNKADQYIKENYMDLGLNVNRLGNHLEISPSYLSKLFKEQYGISILDYLYKIRIEKAKQLLKESSYTIESIATKVGFLNSSAFIKAFKNNEGITPGAYRNLTSNSI